MNLLKASNQENLIHSQQFRKSMYTKRIQYWLVLGCVLLFMQVIIGGITRITGSGLSITKWEIVTGTLPPMNAASWNVEFDKYKATPQYEKLNDGMPLSDFKFIYFWEYFHRLWARMMGFAFLIPALFFTVRKQMDKKLWIKMAPVIGFALLAAIFGWIMVASGLIDRPWVNAYKLSIHLSIAVATFAFLVRATLYSYVSESRIGLRSKIPTIFIILGIILGLQVFFGGVMSGMRAGLVYPTWPDMGGQFIPDILTESKMWTRNNLEDYGRTAFAPALIQFLHRITAYLLAVVVFIAWRAYKKIGIVRNQKRYTLFSLILGIQILVGILTVVSCKGSIPLGLGVLHQAVALVLVGSYVMVWHSIKYYSKDKLHEL